MIFWYGLGAVGFILAIWGVVGFINDYRDMRDYLEGRDDD